MNTEEMLDKICKFKIGDQVTLRSQLNIARSRLSKISQPQFMQIMERTVLQCYGGVQVSYLCRISATSGFEKSIVTVKDPFMFTEPELVEYMNVSEEEKA